MPNINDILSIMDDASTDEKLIFSMEFGRLLKIHNELQKMFR